MPNWPTRNATRTTYKGLRRGGLTPTYAFARARNGQGCGSIETVYATVLPRGALRNFRGLYRLNRDRQNRLYTLHLAHTFKSR